jgi:hypothetical protein
MTKIVQIYVLLLNESTQVWRPVEALKLGKNLFQIISPNPEPDIEKWQFIKGDKVLCDKKTFSDGKTGLVARKKV